MYIIHIILTIKIDINYRYYHINIIKEYQKYDINLPGPDVSLELGLGTFHPMI